MQKIIDAYNDAAQWCFDNLTISPRQAYTFYALGIYIGVFWITKSWVPLIDQLNLLIHETGHPLFGLLVSRLMIYGGTILQLAFPVIFMGYAIRHHKSDILLFSCLWLSTSFFYTGVYMSDARAHILPLVGGGEHDFYIIFSNWGVLRFDRFIGGVFKFFAIFTLFITLWCTWKADKINE